MIRSAYFTIDWNNKITKFSDPFDCETDPCHLAWLIRDNRHLLAPIYGATCSNGTQFTQLISNDFSHCPNTSQIIYNNNQAAHIPINNLFGP